MSEALVITDTTYAGTVASTMLTRAVTGADTVEKGCIMIEDGIKKTKTLPRLEVSGFMQKRQATPTSKGVVTVDAKTLTPLDSMLYYEFNPRDFESHWYAEQLKPRLLDRDLPQTVETFMVMQQMKRLNEFFESAIWRSRIEYDPTGTATDPTSKGEVAAAADYMYFDGLIKKALADANTLQVVSPVALTKTNIRDKFQLAYNMVPKALLFRYGAGGVKFLVSYADQLKYETALREDTYKNQDTTAAGINKYSGYDVVPLAGLPENTFFVCIAKPDVDSNSWLGINSTEDNQLMLARLQANSELFFIKGLFKTDTQWAFADQLVCYTTITA